MTASRQRCQIVTQPGDSREAVEKAIDLAKTSRNLSWERSVKAIEGGVKKWENGQKRTDAARR